MAKHAFRIGGDREPALDIVSYGRRGPGHPDRFTAEQVAQIGRTVRRAPEVMVKVSGGGRSPGAFLAHLKYISRGGDLEVETDDGERHQGREVPAMLVEDWDLEIDAALDRWERIERGGRVMVPKLVHNIVLSMPAGTSPGRLMAASREFAREEFALRHRYAMVLHTDQDHPHVHLVVSAHRLEGGPLNIRKADLRRWREEFARRFAARAWKRTRRQRRFAGGCRMGRETVSTGLLCVGSRESSGSGRGGRLRRGLPRSVGQSVWGGYSIRLTPCNAIG